MRAISFCPLFLLLSGTVQCMNLRRDPFHQGLVAPEQSHSTVSTVVTHIAEVPLHSAANDPLRVITIPMTGVTKAGEADKEARGDCSLAIYKNEKSYKIHYVIKTYNLTGPLPPVSEHIYEGKEGVEGTLRFSLKGRWREQDNPGTVQWNLAGAVSFDANNKSAVQAVKKIIKHPASFYVSVLTKEFPEGAIRGQL